MNHRFIILSSLFLALIAPIGLSTSFQQDNSFEMSNPRIVDSFSQPVVNVATNQRVMIAADLVNNFDFEQPFAYAITITDPNGNTTPPQWISASLVPQQKFTPSLSWTPTSDGDYKISVHVWNNVADKQPLADPLEIGVTIGGSISIPQSVSISSYQAKPVPEWIKNNARWWAAGQLTDNDFTNGIKFLIKERIIHVPQTSVGPDPNFDPDTNPQYYIDRYNNEQEYKDWFDTYYPDKTIEQVVGLEPLEIPQWIRQNAKWWAVGLITEGDFLKGIEFLVEKQIIQI